MKQKLKRFMAGFLAMLTLVGTLFTNGKATAKNLPLGQYRVVEVEAGGC